MALLTQKIISLISDTDGEEESTRSHRKDDYITISSDDENNHRLQFANEHYGRCDRSGGDDSDSDGQDRITHTEQMRYKARLQPNQPRPLTLDEALAQLMVLFPDIEYQYMVEIYREYVREQKFTGTEGVIELEGVVALIVQKGSYPTEGARRRALKRKREEEEKDPDNLRQWTRDERASPTDEYRQVA
jgi:hypothetical protein